MKTSKEPIPHKDYLLNKGDIILSGGNTFIYEILDGPYCRLYREFSDSETYEPWKNESSWYDTGCPKKGWRRSGPNFPSYSAIVIDPDTLEKSSTIITLRWKPTKLNLIDAINVVKLTKTDYHNSPRSVEKVHIDPKRIDMINPQTNVDFCLN